MRFELEHLESYDDESLLAELRRVAALIDSPTITQDQFTSLANVHSSTVGRRFGGWRKALDAAGLSQRFDDSKSQKSREEILAAIRATAEKFQKNVLTIQEFEAHSAIGARPVRRVFGSWKKALEAAGLAQSTLARRYTDEECFENMLAMWTQFGRPPQHDEMNAPPSQVGSKAYVRRWGTWRKALTAFVQRVNSEQIEPASAPAQPEPTLLQQVEVKRGPREIPLGLRYFVLKRDHFRCVTCGASPAIQLGVILHIDHIIPWALGGRTVADNLRTLCEQCNLGKGITAA